jgi:hypothetical protein
MITGLKPGVNERQDSETCEAKLIRTFVETIQEKSVVLGREGFTLWWRPWLRLC